MPRMNALVRELIDHRELLRALVARDLRVRYKQTIMGVGWAFFMPVTLMLLSSAVFSRAVKVETGGVPYPVFAYVGLLPWTFFANSVKFSSGSLIGNMNLVTKVAFPREVLPLACVGACLFDLAIAASVLLGLLAWYHVPLHATALLAPVLLAIQVALTVAASYFVAMASLFYRDVKYVVDVGLLVLMFATAVIYPVEGIHGVTGAVLAANPLSVLLEGYRAVLVRGEMPALAPLGATAAASLVLLAASWRLFHEAEFKFAERV